MDFNRFQFQPHKRVDSCWYFSVKFVATPSAVGTVYWLIFIYKAPAALIEMIDFESTTLTYPWAGFEVLFWGHSSFSSGKSR
jgi:hypothetical protein